MSLTKEYPNIPGEDLYERLQRIDREETAARQYVIAHCEFRYPLCIEFGLPANYSRPIVVVERHVAEKNDWEILPVEVLQ